MDDLQKDIIKRFADDEKTSEAVLLTLLESLNLDTLNLDKPNEEVGAEARARLRAKELVITGFKQIRKLKTSQKVVKQELNPGR